MAHDLPFRVELWNDKDTQVIALTADYATAKSAYEEAAKRRPEGSSRFARKLGHSEHAKELTVLA
jgi:hypothetical protein